MAVRKQGGKDKNTTREQSMIVQVVLCKTAVKPEHSIRQHWTGIWQYRKILLPLPASFR